MNKHRHKERRFSITEVIVLALAAVVLMAGGVVHAWIKNSHVEVIRDVDQAEQRISDHEDAINSLQVKIDKKLNIYQLRDDLERAESRLVLVPASSIEVIPVYSTPRNQARASRESTPIAQRRP
ncbi:MAG: hypothetical protein AB8F34_15935 [Akkermansiaceae bacterium]